MKNILDLNKNWDWLEKKESLEYLYLINYSELKPLVIKALKDDDLFISAVFILWEIWNIDDIKYLSKSFIFLESWDEWSKIFFEKQIQDSIEKILYKSEMK